MKRHIIRLSVLSVVVVLGLIAIAQARYGNRTETGPETPLSAADLPATAPQPIQVDALANPLSESNSPVNPLRSAAAVQDRFGAAESPGLSARAALVRHETRLAQAAEELPAELALPPADPSDIPDYQAEPQPLAAADDARYGAAPPTDLAPHDYAPASQPTLATPQAAAQAAPQAAPRPFQSSRVPPANIGQAGQPTPAAEPAPYQGEQFDAAPPVDSQYAPATAPTLAGQEPYAAPQANRFAPTEAQPLTAANGHGRPGGEHLEGLQSASVTLRKIAPREIQVGKECVFEIIVRNGGRSAAQGIEIHDQIPQGTTFIGAEPRPSSVEGGTLVWQIGELAAGQETKVAVRLMPVAEGEIGSVATLHFSAGASASAVATKPQLALKLSANPQVMLGEKLRLGIEISNPGTGPTTGVVLFANIPPGVSHPAGESLEFEVGTLAPGEAKKLELELTAAEAGLVKNAMSATADANLQAQDTIEFEVVAAELAVTVEGPARRYLERPATYHVSVGNPGTAAAKEVELTTYLPKGMKFVKANNEGQYDAQTHSVSWGLAELPAKQSGSVELVAMPMEAGEQSLRVEGKAERGLTDNAEQTVQVEGLAAIMFTVVDVQDPIELNGETAYEIRIVNQGSKASDNVHLTAILPQGVQPTSASGPTPFEIRGNQVVFAPLARLAPKADATYTVNVQMLAPGDHRIRVQVETDELETPVTKEESTRVYAD